jgi:hypothetical protein
MKTSVSVSDFRDAFNALRPDNFSYEGLGVLFEYLEEYEDSCGVEVELDVIAICCDFNEDHWSDIADNYRIDLDDCDDDDDERQAAVLEYLQEHTSVVGEVGESIIYQAF